MIEDLLVHPRTLLQIKQFLIHPTHSLILSGPFGAGKQTIAEVVAATVLNLQSLSKLHSYPYYSVVNPNESTITIDEIRSLEQFLKLKTPLLKKQEIRRVITIINAGRMRVEAQNAFLKNLEEPPSDTCIVMTAESNSSLLATIYSRSVTIEVLPVSVEQAQEFYSRKGISSKVFSRNFALSQGQIGLLNSLINDDDHPLKNAVDTAKQLLALSPGERLFKTEELSKDKEAFGLLLNALMRICHAALMNAAQSSNAVAVDRWRSSLAVIQFTVDATYSNANTKLLLDNLLLNL